MFGGDESEKLRIEKVADISPRGVWARASQSQRRTASCSSAAMSQGSVGWMSTARPFPGKGDTGEMATSASGTNLPRLGCAERT